MRYAARVDANQTQIVSALRAAGATVQSLSAVGQGCPDLLVGYQGINILMELKDGKKPPSERKLTSDQIVWHSEWKGVVFLVTSVDEALQLLMEKKNERC
jgi:hypothetical protein